MHLGVRENLILKGAVWNSLGSIMYGLNSFVMLSLVGRYASVEETGWFGIAFTTAQILYIVGLLGVNHYQQTDYGFKYSFRDYQNTKLCSCVLMWIGCFLAAVLLHYSGTKLKFTIVLTLLMMLNSVGELYQSLFFQNNRLDLSGSCLFFRTFWSLIAFCSGLIITRNVLVSICFQIIVNCFVTSIYRIRFVPRYTKEYIYQGNKRWISLCVECFPLFISTLLMNVIINISKYSVDIQMDDTAQGYYNMIFIIIQVINLCNQFIFKPFLYRFAQDLDNGEYGLFIKRISGQVVLIAFITCVATICAWMIGPEVLGFVYNKSISDYRLTMACVVIGGGVFAVTQLFYFVFVIMRKQLLVVLIYIIGTVLSGWFAYSFVWRYGLNGAAQSVIVSQLGIAFLYIFAFIVIMHRKIRGAN